MMKSDTLSRTGNSLVSLMLNLMTDPCDQGCFIEGYAVKQDFVVSFQSENRVHGVIKPPCNTRTLISVSMIPVESNVIKTRRL